MRSRWTAQRPLVERPTARGLPLRPASFKFLCFAMRSGRVARSLPWPAILYALWEKTQSMRPFSPGAYCSLISSVVCQNGNKLRGAARHQKGRNRTPGCFHSRSLADAAYGAEGCCDLRWCTDGVSSMFMCHVLLTPMPQRSLPILLMMSIN